MKRDFFPDLLKLEALEDYIRLKESEQNPKVPSVLINSTGQSRVSRMPSTMHFERMPVDPADKLTIAVTPSARAFDTESDALSSIGL